MCGQLAARRGSAARRHPLPRGTVERLLLSNTVTFVVTGHQIGVADLDIRSNIHRGSILPLTNFKTTDCGQFNIIQIIKNFKTYILNERAQIAGTAQSEELHEEKDAQGTETSRYNLYMYRFYLRCKHYILSPHPPPAQMILFSSAQVCKNSAYLVNSKYIYIIQGQNRDFPSPFLYNSTVSTIVFIAIWYKS